MSYEKWVDVPGVGAVRLAELEKLHSGEYTMTEKYAGPSEREVKNPCPAQGVNVEDSGCCGSCVTPESDATQSLISTLANHTEKLAQLAAATEGLINVVGALVYQNSLMLQMMNGEADENDEPEQPDKYMDGSPVWPKSKGN